MGDKTWKDTVMGEGRYLHYEETGMMSGKWNIDSLLEAQAEQTGDIAYKAGYETKESEFELALIELEEVLDNGVKIGRKEVVDWLLQYNHPILNKRSDCLIPSGIWQSKLKEWGRRNEETLP